MAGSQFCNVRFSDTLPQHIFTFCSRYTLGFAPGVGKLLSFAHVGRRPETRGPVAVGMEATGCRRLHMEPIIADRADHLPIDVAALLTEHRLGRHRAGAGRLFEEAVDYACIRMAVARPTMDYGRPQHKPVFARLDGRRPCSWRATVGPPNSS